MEVPYEILVNRLPININRRLTEIPAGTWPPTSFFKNNSEYSYFLNFVSFSLFVLTAYTHTGEFYIEKSDGSRGYLAVFNGVLRPSYTYNPGLIIQPGDDIMFTFSVGDGNGSGIISTQMFQI